MFWCDRHLDLGMRWGTHLHQIIRQYTIPKLIKDYLGEWAIALHGMYESTLVFISVLK